MTKWLLPMCCCLLSSSAALAITGDEILEKVDRNLTPEAYEAYRKLINIEPDGSRREFVLFTLKKGEDKVVSLFISPASEEGRATLRLGENMWLYMPDVGRPIRITSLQSVVGGVFNNADIMRLDYHLEYRVEANEDLGDVWLLTLKARTRTVAASSGLLIKTLHFKDVKDYDGGIRRPSVVETDSPLQKGYRSVMIFAGMKRRQLPDETFTLSFLPRVESLR